MRLTHLGHACLLVEMAGARLLIDPGEYSRDFTSLRDLDAVLVTHQHADHVDEERLPRLLEANPTAVLFADPETARMAADLVPAAEVRPLPGGATTTVGAVAVDGVGDRHALNHDAVPTCANSGFVLSGDGEPTLFHPGDAYDAEPGRPVDVLALPLSAPWCAVRDTLQFVRRISPGSVVPVHDVLLSPTGRRLYLHHVAEFGARDAQLRDLSSGEPEDFS